jgi:hypothetical protein
MWISPLNAKIRKAAPSSLNSTWELDGFGTAGSVAQAPTAWFNSVTQQTDHSPVFLSGKLTGAWCQKAPPGRSGLARPETARLKSDS